MYTFVPSAPVPGRAQGPLWHVLAWRRLRTLKNVADLKTLSKVLKWTTLFPHFGSAASAFRGAFRVQSTQTARCPVPGDGQNVATKFKFVKTVPLPPLSMLKAGQLVLGRCELDSQECKFFCPPPPLRPTLRVGGQGGAPSTFTCLLTKKLQHLVCHQ